MRKFLLLLSLNFLFCNVVFAESYFFKGCKISNAVTAEYNINVDLKLVQVTLRALDGKVQNFTDKIKTIEKDKIISEKIRSGTGQEIYFQYFLNSKSKSVVKLEYKKEKGIDMDMFKLIGKRQSYCEEVIANWDVEEIEAVEISEEEERILAAQEKLMEEQSRIIDCQEDDKSKWNKCMGSFKGEDGRNFFGYFKNGAILKGTATYSDGAKYVGHFLNNNPNGYGTFYWTNGVEYYGEWKNGKSHGSGTKIWKDGTEYSGQFVNDKIHGKGTLTYTNGEKYVGEFKDGKRHGEGTYTYADGSAYIGKFIAGHEHGEGECISKDGSSTKCTMDLKYSTGKDTKNISFVAKKWVRLSQYKSNKGKAKKIIDKLKTDFDKEAVALCASVGSYKIIEKKIEVLEIDETPAYGLEPKLQLAINGVIECK